VQLARVTHQGEIVMPTGSENRAPYLQMLYGTDERRTTVQKKRYARLSARFEEHFQTRRTVHFFSTPGRIEIGGNHTDHNHGSVLAAGIDLDAIAVVAKSGEKRITILSEGYRDPFVVDLRDLDVREEEKGTTSALVRGIASHMKGNGHRIGGFNACIQSQVLPGSGLSSSAVIEVLIGTILNGLYNHDEISPGEIARTGQVAENAYFGKPCGRMDQIACALGGILHMDFENPDSPLIDAVDFDFGRQGYRILIVDTGGSHADLTDDYAAIPREMQDVAGELGHNVCRDTRVDDLMERAASLREKTGDRALLRALHFHSENQRVTDQVQALRSGDFNRFLDLVQASGDSSIKWLQNIYSTSNPSEQGISLALALTEKYAAGVGACRVHGGGFAGTILALLPDPRADAYVALMASVFGPGCVLKLSVRTHGTLHLNSP